MQMLSHFLLAFAALKFFALDVVYTFAMPLNLNFTDGRCITGIGPVVLDNAIDCSLPPRKKCEIRMSYCPNGNTTIPTAPQDAVDIATISNVTYNNTFSDVGNIEETTDDFFYVLYNAYADDPGAILTGNGYVFYSCNGTTLQYNSTFGTLHYQTQNDSALERTKAIEHWHIANETSNETSNGTSNATSNETAWNWLALYDELLLPASPVQQLHRQGGLPDVVFLVNATNVSTRSVSFDHRTKGNPVAIVRRNTLSGFSPTNDVCNNFVNQTLKVPFYAEYHLFHELIYHTNGPIDL